MKRFACSPISKGLVPSCCRSCSQDSRKLADKLASRGLAQLRQRISLLSRLQPLLLEETKDYIQHRLSVAGYVGGPMLTSQALAIIIEFTEGIPRNINNFCFNDCR